MDDTENTKNKPNAAASSLTRKAYDNLITGHADTLVSFNEAYAACVEVSERLVICAGALNTYFSAWSNMVGVKIWLARFAEADRQPQPQAEDTPIDALRINCARLCATRLTDDSTFTCVDVDATFSRARDLLRKHIINMALKDTIIHVPILAEICQVLRRPAEAHEIELLVSRDPRFVDIPPIWQGRFWDWLSAAYFILDDHKHYEIAEANTWMIAEKFSIETLAFDLRKKPLRIALEKGDTGKAKALLDEMRTFFNPSHAMQATEYWDMDGRIKLALRDYSGAEDSYRRAITAADESEGPVGRYIVLWAMSGAVFVAAGNEARAIEAYQKTVECSSGTQLDIMRTGLAIVEAWFAWKNGRADATQRLREAMGAASRLNLLRFMRPLAGIAAEVCHAALELNIEADFCKRVIALRGLAAPAMSGNAWPHAIKVNSFGGFQIVVAGCPLTAQAKPQVKPLQLLRMLAANEGLALPVARVVNALWPDAAPETARASFDNALARLKKILGRDDLVKLESGKITADQSLVWFDTRAVSEIALHIETTRETNTVLVRRHINRLLNLYQGLFQQNEDDDAWLLVARERFQQRFLRALEAAGAQLEAAGEHEALLLIYQRALDVEPYTESIYRRLMQCHKNLGNHAEALQVYRRCHRMLSVAVGIPPSQQTESLMKEIYREHGVLAQTAPSL
jgi:DNA-binding SARP family transcriptional activator